MTNTWRIIGEICDHTLETFLRSGAVGADSLRLLVKSPGGDLSVCSALIDLLQPLRINGNLETVAIGEVCSAAPLLVASGSPGFRMTYRNCSWGLHQPYLETEVVTEEQVRLFQSMVDRFNVLLAEMTGRRQSFWRRKLEGGGMKFFSSKEAIRLGLVDVMLS